MKDTQTSSACESISSPLQSQTNAPRRILVVEDDTVTRQISIQILIRSGYAVDAAEDGAAGWQALNTDRYDLLVTDNKMPKVSGVELLKKLRAARMLLPVIMVTGTLPNEEFTRSPWIRPTATLLKPYTVEEFLITVKEVLRATNRVCEPDTPPPNWQSQESAEGMQAG